jgi:ubiquinone/menaquinone biosynthesis C-methylase UbiE
MEKTKTFLEPDKIFDQVSLDVGDSVADFGVGAGHFSIEAARRVGKTGRVYSLDVLSSALESIESRAALENLECIEGCRVNFERVGGSGLADSSVSLVIVKDVLFMNEDKRSILTEAFRVLALGGHMLVIEWKNASSPIGPSIDKRISEEELLRLAKEVGFSGERRIEVGDYHYGFLFEKMKSKTI